MIQTALVLGNGTCAREVAGELLALGMDVLLAAAENSVPVEPAGGDQARRQLTCFQKAVLNDFRGTVGNFAVSLTVDGRRVDQRVGAVVIAEADVIQATHDVYGLQLGPGVAALSELSPPANSPAVRALDDGKHLEGVRTAVFISGLARESSPSVTRRVMECACRLQVERGVQTFVLAGNLKVAGEGLEALCRRAKEAGTVFVKFDDDLPRFHQASDGKVTIEFEDPIMKAPCRLRPDLCIADEIISPSPHLARLAETLRIDAGPDGFLQTDNVHRQTVFTLRKGVLAVGPARCAQSAGDHAIDARNAALAVYGLLNPVGEGPFPKAEIDKGSCIRCLTCFRLCPYRAVEVAQRVSVAHDACEGCGICAAECPREAIRIEGLSKEEIASRLTPPEARPVSPVPHIVAFCCSRSAAKAARGAACAGYALPAGLTIVEVPCAGAISLNHLLTAYRKGVDGVVVMTCHTDNCHSEHGNAHAHMRVGHLAKQLELIGLAPQRLQTASLAANMGREFSDIVLGFEAGLTGSLKTS